MKTLNRIFGAALLSMALAACGSQNSNPYAMNPYLNPNGLNPNTQSGCQNLQSGTFSFSAQGAQLDTVKILAGNIPAQSYNLVTGLMSSSPRAGNYGQVAMGGMNGMGASGGYQMSPYMGTYGNINQLYVGQNALSGTIQLSQQAIYTALAVAGNTGGYTNGTYPTGGSPNGGFNNGYMNGACVSSIGLWVVHQNNAIWGATVYLYLNNSQVPLSIQL